MEQRLIEVLQRLPIAVRIVEQALTSIFTFIAEDAGYSPADFKHTSHTTLY